MTKKLILVGVALLALGLHPAGAATAPPPSEVLSVGGVPMFRVTWVPDASLSDVAAPDVFQTTNRLGQPCVGIEGATEMVSICSAGMGTPQPGAPAPRTHLPNPPFGLCFSQHIWFAPTKGHPWLFICVCVPDLHPTEGPEIAIFEDIEGNPANCVGVKALGGFAWVCVLQV